MNSIINLGILLYISMVTSCTVQSNVRFTFYGYPDNSPPGAGIAYDCGRGYSAGGDGTHDNPLTMATAPGEYNKCEVVYLPYLKKYVRFEDVCAQCTSDWSGGLAHIDMWIGSTTSNGGQNVVNCENSLTPDQGQAVIRNPASDLPVNSAELFLSGRCHTENVYKNQDPSQFCSGGGDNGGDGSCSWPGHCAGASCSDVNDCSDDLICLSGSCGSQ